MAPSTVSAPGAPPEPPRTWWQRRLLDPFLALLKAGLSPASLALTVGLGMVIGAAPTFGLTTILCTIVALRLRLNLAAMQLVCHLMSPVQLLLLLPLLRYGAVLLGHGEEVATLTLRQIEHMFRQEPGQLLSLIWRAELGAVLLWAIISVPLVAGLYFVLKPVFARVLRRQQDAAAEPEASAIVP